MKDEPIVLEEAIDKLLLIAYDRLKSRQSVEYGQLGLKNSMINWYVKTVYERYQIVDPLAGTRQSICHSVEDDQIVESRYGTPGNSSRNKISRYKKSLRQQLQKTAIQSLKRSSMCGWQTTRHRITEPIGQVYRFCPMCQSSEQQIEQNHAYGVCPFQSFVDGMTIIQKIDYFQNKIRRIEQSMLYVLKECKEDYNEEGLYNSIVGCQSMEDPEEAYKRLMMNIPTKGLTLLELGYKLKEIRKWVSDIKQRF